MSYARFGPDSDVFVYTSVQNTLVVSVSRTRFTPEPGRTAPVRPNAAHMTSTQYEQALAEYRYAVERGTYTEIGGRRDGLSYQVRSPGECAALLRGLQQEGYLVPDTALATLDNQQRQLPVFAH